MTNLETMNRVLLLLLFWIAVTSVLTRDIKLRLDAAQAKIQQLEARQAAVDARTPR